MSRKYTDCRDTPSVSGCSLKISGEEEEVVLAAAQHMATVHGHEDTPEVRKMIRVSLKDDDDQRPAPPPLRPEELTGPMATH